MPDTKQCPHCGRIYEQPWGESPSHWASRKYCSRACASKATATQRRSSEKRPAETKTCPICGAVFARHGLISNCNWARRLYCSQSCAGVASGKNRAAGIRQLETNCECGAEAIGIVWIVQGSADGYLHRQCVEVCADCREMWLEDGATLEPPTVVNEQPKYQEPAYCKPAHWFHRHREY